MVCKSEIKEAKINLKQTQSNLKSDQSELKKKQADLKKTEKEYEKDKANMESMRKVKAKLEDEMKKLGFEDGKEDDMENQYKTRSANVDNLSDKVNALTSTFHNLHFEYSENNFDRSKIHGLVARLIKVKDVKYATSL